MTDAPDGRTAPRRCAFVAVVGATNAGKSTLVNRLVGAKVSIVTHKVQTTRAQARGVAIEGAAQLVFIDTPGVFRPRRKLDRAMVAAAWESLAGADAVLMVVDAASWGAGGKDRGRVDAEAIVAGLKDRGVRAILALNKIDLLTRDKLLPLIAELDGTGAFRDVFLIAAKNGDGVSDLKAALAARAPEGAWMYPEDQLSDVSDRLMAAEITREKLYLRLHQELPYDSAVETTGWRRAPNGRLEIDQTVFVSRDSQKPIVLGRGGETIKAIGSAARADIEEILGEPARLNLFVKVREGWSEEAARLREMGLDLAD
ncbi:MAG: GTPase Era [Parvularculaceae bacterium]